MKAVSAESFYVRPMAMWVPDRLIPNFVPSCPHCKSNQHVEVSKARWQNSPKVLFGVNGYRYLDTKLYPCRSCKRQFAGYNPQSMKEDGQQYLGYFNFHFSGRFAVDEDLYSFICSNYDTPTPKIHCMLQQMAVDSYLNDYQLYLHAARSKKIKMVQRPDVSTHDSRQRTLLGSTDGASTARKLSANERTLKSIRSELQSAKFAYTHATARAAERICLKKLRRLKSQRNYRDVVLPFVGPRKIDDLIAEGIMDARGLMEYPGVPRRWCGSRDQSRWFEWVRAKAVALYSERQAECNSLSARIEDLEEQLAEAEAVVEIGRIVTEEGTGNVEAPAEEELPPLFSKMLDKYGYCGKVISKDRIDCIHMTYFLHRKPIQKAKMMGLGAEVLKIDFEYKIVKKIHLHTGVGKAFWPYKCLATVQNENNQTMYYKVCQGSEAIDEIKKGLVEFEKRNEQEVKVIYVDKRCSVRQKLLDIFPTAVVKLDPFH